MNNKYHVYESSRENPRAGVLCQSYNSRAKSHLQNCSTGLRCTSACCVLAQRRLTNSHPCQGARTPLDNKLRSSLKHYALFHLPEVSLDRMFLLWLLPQHPNLTSSQSVSLDIYPCNSTPILHKMKRDSHRTPQSWSYEAKQSLHPKHVVFFALCLPLTLTIPQ